MPEIPERRLRPEDVLDQLPEDLTEDERRIIARSVDRLDQDGYLFSPVGHGPAAGTQRDLEA